MKNDSSNDGSLNAFSQVNSSLKINSDHLTSKLIYFGDPMCSWCWGLTNHLNKIVNTFKDKLDFEMIMGGLRPGGGDLWNDAMKSFIRQHWVHVEQRSGQPFRFDLLNRESFNYDTEPACRAVRVIRDLLPEKEFEFFRRIQYAFYVENEDPTISNFYRNICEQVEIDFNEFIDLFESTQYMKLVKEDFISSQNYGIRGFPSLILKTADKNEVITIGYAEYEKMEERINSILQIH